MVRLMDKRRICKTALGPVNKFMTKQTVLQHNVPAKPARKPLLLGTRPDVEIMCFDNISPTKIHRPPASPSKLLTLDTVLSIAGDVTKFAPETAKSLEFPLESIPLTPKPRVSRHLFPCNTAHDLVDAPSPSLSSSGSVDTDDLSTPMREDLQSVLQNFVGEHPELVQSCTPNRPPSAFSFNQLQVFNEQYEQQYMDVDDMNILSPATSTSSISSIESDNMPTPLKAELRLALLEFIEENPDFVRFTPQH